MARKITIWEVDRSEDPPVIVPHRRYYGEGSETVQRVPNFFATQAEAMSNAFPATAQAPESKPSTATSSGKIAKAKR